MQIRCPECQLEREIDPSRIPASAVMATCPQCKAKFRFRTIDPQDEASSAAESIDSDAAEATELPSVPAEPVVLVKPGQTAAKEPAEETVARPVNLSPGAAKSTESPLRDKAEATADHNTPEADWLDVPWERPDRYGHLMGLYQTIVRVMFNAPRFFFSLSKCRGSIMRPLLFYVLLGVFQTVVKLAWFQSVAPSVTDPQVQELLSSTDMSLALTLLVAPGILAAQLFLYSVLFFLMLRLVQPDQVIFATVLRVVAYSSAPMVVCAVPVLGPVVGLVWFAACCFMGCRFALNLQWHKVALALVPLYLIGFVITMQFVEHLLQQG